MPVSPTYPGVYVEEISSGVRTITGVATSITAFIGRAKRGPVNEPVTINNFGDYERIFGGLVDYSSMSYAVRDFYLNGGAQAIIVRLFGGDIEGNTAKISIDGLTLKAASPGKWGSGLNVSIDLDVSGELEEQLGVKLFNLTVTDGSTTEIYMNITVQGESERRIDKVLQAQSSLIKLSGTLPAGRPELEKIYGEIGKIADAEKAVREAKKALLYATEKEKEAKKTELNSAKEKLSDLIDKEEGSDGQPLKVDEYIARGPKKGLYALEKVDLFNLLCIPPYTESKDVNATLIDTAAAYCEKRRALLIVDPHSDWIDKTKILKQDDPNRLDQYVITRSRNAALFFPRLKQPNPEHDNRIEEFAPCGAVAGIMARTDTERGVWKAPAGIDATLRGVPELSVKLTDAENGELNPRGVNCLRSFPNIGRVVWGARTLKGDDNLADEYKYIPIRRLALFIEESLFRGTQWVVFEPNDEPLWAQIRMNVGAFMHTLFRQGAFQGTSPKQAYFVKCDQETNPQNDIDRGIVNIVVGFAPLKPAEFVVIKLQQIAGDLEF